MFEYIAGVAGALVGGGVVWVGIVRRQDAQIIEQGKQITEQGKQVQALVGVANQLKIMVSERDQVISEQKQENSELKQEISEQKQVIIEKDQVIDEQKEMLGKKDRTIANLEKQAERLKVSSPEGLGAITDELAREENENFELRERNLKLGSKVKIEEEKSARLELENRDYARIMRLFQPLIRILRNENLSEIEIARAIDKLASWHAAFNSDMPSNPLVDPIFLDLIEEPRIMPSNGVTYSTKAIAGILNEAKRAGVAPRCPMTREVIPLELNDKNYQRNRNLESILEIVSSSTTPKELLDALQNTDVVEGALTIDRVYLNLVNGMRSNSSSSSSNSSGTGNRRSLSP